MLMSKYTNKTTREITTNYNKHFKEKRIMKKSYLMIAAVLTFAACSNNELINDISTVNDNETVMIGFQTFHEKATKATVTDVLDDPTDFTPTHGGFGVWGFKGASVPALNSWSSIATTDYTTVFDNVKVYYDGTSLSKGFTYAVPKYWDKNAKYIFFAYAPYDATNASLDLATGTIEVAAIPSIQDVSTSSGTGADLVYSGETTTGITDYLMATAVTNQSLTAANTTTTATGTNENYGDGSAVRYAYQQQTVGFVFGHMLSKLQVNVKGLEAQSFAGVEYIQVTGLSIENMPALAASPATTTFTQTSPAGPAGTYSPANYTTDLVVIGANGTYNPSTQGLYILKGGTGSATGVTNSPTKQTQSFNYYVAPNAPTGTGHDKYYLNISYKIHYVDNTEETVTINDVDLTAATATFTSLAQNNQYILNISVALNQIYFNVQSVTGWDTASQHAITVQ